MVRDLQMSSAKMRCRKSVFIEFSLKKKKIFLLFIEFNFLINFFRSVSGWYAKLQQRYAREQRESGALGRKLKI